ncbi:hypothetical protein VKT23_016876 [Stygiomarasmius scandens]|uniref:Uncharacterized protein n=1 Tax=Marasmiellus scandens TaxID=2682957 RepID=A0ABR1IV93_9AGAR
MCGSMLATQGVFEFSVEQAGTFDFEFWVVEDASGTFISDPFQADKDSFKFSGTILAKSEPFTVTSALQSQSTRVQNINSVPVTDTTSTQFSAGVAFQE